jgi:hypothetical protein
MRRILVDERRLGEPGRRKVADALRCAHGIGPKRTLQGGAVTRGSVYAPRVPAFAAKTYDDGLRRCRRADTR